MSWPRVVKEKGLEAYLEERIDWLKGIDPKWEAERQQRALRRVEKLEETLEAARKQLLDLERDARIELMIDYTTEGLEKERSDLIEDAKTDRHRGGLAVGYEPDRLLWALRGGLLKVRTVRAILEDGKGRGKRPIDAINRHLAEVAVEIDDELKAKGVAKADRDRIIYEVFCKAGVNLPSEPTLKRTRKRLEEERQAREEEDWP